MLFKVYSYHLDKAHIQNDYLVLHKLLYSVYNDFYIASSAQVDKTPVIGTLSWYGDLCVSMILQALPVELSCSWYRDTFYCIVHVHIVFNCVLVYI